MRNVAFCLAVATCVLASCRHDSAETRPGPAVDKAVIAAALEDFANWKEATFGELQGVLVLEPSSEASPNATADGVRSLAPGIESKLDDDVVNAFVERNRSVEPVASLVSASPWARLQQSTTTGFRFAPPDGAKAIGTMTLPGYSADGSRALVQIHHSWSMHAAVVTYVLQSERGKWRVVARDQTVFL